MDISADIQIYPKIYLFENDIPMDILDISDISVCKYPKSLDHLVSFLKFTKDISKDIFGCIGYILDISLDISTKEIYPWIYSH